MSILRTFLSTSVSLLLIACVTVNITFPPDKAADQIIDKVYGTQQPEQPSDNKKGSSVPFALVWVTKLSGCFITPVYAEEISLSVSSPTIDTLTQKMAQRHQKLLPFYNSGAIGLTGDALIALRDPAKVPLKSRNDINRWIGEENQDRLALYREIATANGHPEWEAKIRATFATRWKKKAAANWWCQNKGQWQQRCQD